MRARVFAIASSLLVLSGASPPSMPEVEVVYVPGSAATRPDDPAWDRAPEVKLSLMAQLITPPHGGGSRSEVSVRAMHDAEWLAVRLEWADTTADRTVDSDTFRDAAAVGFPLGNPEPPPAPFMGDAEHPVVIWQWTADLEADERGQGGFAERYPTTEGVWYFPQDTAVRREVRAWRGRDAVCEFVATGFGTLDRRARNNVQGVSARDKGRWSVVLRRRLATGEAEDVSFKPGERTRLIVAVWDGTSGEVNGRKSLTINWTPFVLGATVGSLAGR